MDDKDKDKDARGALAEDEPDDKPEAEEEPEGDEPSSACAKCNSANEPNAKFCDQCGSSMAVEIAGDDDPPPSSKKPGAAVAAPKAMGAEATVAAIVRATSESVPAIKTAAIQMRQVFDTAAAVTGKSDAGEIVGALLAIPHRMAKGKAAIAARAEEKRGAAKAERWALAKRLNALGLDTIQRSSIFVDKVNAQGERESIALTDEYKTKDLDVLRGLVEALEPKAPTRRKNPFEASDSKAREALDTLRGKTANGEPTAAQIAAATKEPAVIRMFNASNGAKPIEAYAKHFLLEAAKLGGIQ